MQNIQKYLADEWRDKQDSSAEAESKWSVVHAIPNKIQFTGSDCGVFLCMFIIFVTLQSARLPFQQADIHDIRLWIAQMHKS